MLLLLLLVHHLIKQIFVQLMRVCLDLTVLEITGIISVATLGEFSKDRSYLLKIGVDSSACITCQVILMPFLAFDHTKHLSCDHSW